MRVAMLSVHFSEYCVRYATSFSRDNDMLLVLDRQDLERQMPGFQPGSTAPSLRILTADLFGVRLPIALNWLRILLSIIRFRPDLVHFQEMPDRKTALLQWLISPFYRTALTVHDPFPHSGNDSGLGNLTFRLRDLARGRSDLYLVHGEACGTHLAAALPRAAGRIVTTHHGVLMCPERHGEPIPGTILFFGRMEAYKGLDVLTEALGLLRERGVPYRAIIAGRGPELDRLGPVLAADPQTVVIKGFVSAEDAARIFQEAAVVVIPYKDATQSGVAAAAYGNHRPVVASAVGGLPDVVDDGVNGLLVPPSDPAALADALARALTDPDLYARLRQGAEETARTKLNWDRIAAQAAADLQSRA